MLVNSKLECLRSRDRSKTYLQWRIMLQLRVLLVKNWVLLVMTCEFGTNLDIFTREPSFMSVHSEFSPG